MDRDFEIFSIGHSNLSYENFVNILLHIGATAIVDVRSAPYSRRVPQFNRETLQRELQADSISYLFLGAELGGRPSESRYFCDGVADYDKMATAPSFKIGIERVLAEKGSYRLALMCSEHSPYDCHRCLLVGRALKEESVSIGHVLPNGNIHSQETIEAELLRMSSLGSHDMFKPSEDNLAKAYRARSLRVAYSESGQVARSVPEQYRDSSKRDNNRIHKNHRRAFL